MQPSTRFDLHVHSTRSDGRFDTAEVLRRAAGKLDVVALTDHDLGPGVEPGVHRIGGHELRVIGGAEVSGLHEGQEFHLLVYFPGEVPPGFTAFCQARCQERAVRYATAVERIALPDLPPVDAEAERGDRALTRLHLASALVQAGHVPSRAHAFSRYLSARLPIVPPLTLPFTEAIAAARRFGGLTSWAHPPIEAIDRYLPAFVAAGLQGVEALRPTVSGPHRRRLRAVARRNGLYLTGGSDWHGWGDPDDFGLFRVEAREIRDFVDALLAA